jgi:hypothetical protein
MGCRGGVQGQAVENAAGAGRCATPAGVSTGVPGVERAPSSCVRNMETPFGSGPVRVGRPTVRRAQVPGGQRMTEKRMPAAERRLETIVADQSSN